MKDIVYVDENDNEIGHGSYEKAIQEGIIRRVSRVVVTNHNAQVLVQQRSKHVAFPLHWNDSVSGHVDAGETYEQAALREMKEEMGIEGVSISLVDTFYIEEEGWGIRKSFDTVFHAQFNGEISIDEKEVADFKWVSMKELQKWLVQSPDEFTPGSRESLSLFLEKNT